MTDSSTHPATPERRVVLVVDDDADIGNLLEDFLTGEGYAVALLQDRRAESVQGAVGRIGPDCVLLDGYARGRHGGVWGEAAWMRNLASPVPVIMFTGEQGATAEARINLSERSQAAGFSAVLRKPFDIDELLQVLAEAVAHSPSRSGA